MARGEGGRFDRSDTSLPHQLDKEKNGGRGEGRECPGEGIDRTYKTQRENQEG